MSGLAFFNLGACRCLLPLTVMAKDDAANATITNTNATDIEESLHADAGVFCGAATRRR